MSTSPDSRSRTDDRLVTAISRWLAGHASNEDLRRELEVVGHGELDREQAEAVEELRGELDDPVAPAELEMVARETLEALALGG